MRTTPGQTLPTKTPDDGTDDEDTELDPPDETDTELDPPDEDFTWPDPHLPHIVEYPGVHDGRRP